jgi:RAT1-interacting protein
MLTNPQVWDSKPQPGQPINWVELKTSAEIRSPHDLDNFHRKLMKYWIQSFLLGVPKIIVGFRTRDGVLVSVEEMETQNIPQTVNARQGAKWNADMCVNFAAEFLECEPPPLWIPSCPFVFYSHRHDSNARWLHG